MSAPDPSKGVDIDLLRWIPLGARRVLEIDCGDAALAALYKRRNPDVEYVAVEGRAPFGVAARSRVDRLVQADFGALTNAEIADLGQFDAIVLRRVLERSIDPWTLLRTLAGLLTPTGQVVASTSNASHWSNIANLMAGDRLSNGEGGGDHGNPLSFTFEALRAMIAGCSLQLERARPSFDPDTAKAKRWLPILQDAAEKGGLNKDAFSKLARTTHYITTSRRPDAPPLARMHIHFAAFAPDYLDVRTRLPMEALESEPSLTLSYRERSTALPVMSAEIRKVAILQRVMVRDERELRNYIDHGRKKGWIFVYEIDDHPDLIGRVHELSEADAALKVSVAYNCHAVQTSTGMLADALRALNPEAAVFPNCVFDLPPLEPRPGVRRIFYGALNREAFSSKIAAALAPLFATDPEVDFEIVHDRAFFDALPTTRKRFHPVLPYKDYLELMSSCDVVLSPLEGRGGEAYKSDVKFLEASRAGAVMIASPAVYAATIQDGVTGFIARDPEDWAAHLSRLIAQPALRNDVANAAWRYVKADRMMSKQVALRRNWYRNLFDRRGELDDALSGRWNDKPLV